MDEECGEERRSDVELEALPVITAVPVLDDLWRYCWRWCRLTRERV